MEEILKTNQLEQSNVNIVNNSNADDGFLTEEEASDYVAKEKEWWGSNLVGWVEKRNDKFFPCFNVWD